MKRILLISDLFYPNNIIGGLRPTKIAKALTARGWQVDVFTRYKVDPKELSENGICSHLYGVDEIPQPEPPREPGFLGRIKKNIKQNHPALFSHLKKITDYTFYRDTVRDADRMKAELQKRMQAPDFPKYDAVISTFGPLSSVVCGLFFKEAHPEVNWICDFRDPMVSKHLPHVFRKKFGLCQEEACRKADSIVAVSNGYLERICKGRYSEKSYMIPNGYDLHDFQSAEDVKKSTDRFTISYVGALYGGDRDLTPMFRAVSELIQEGIMEPKHLNIAYAGDEADVFKAQAQKFRVQDLVSDHGILPRRECLKLQFSSHMLVLSTWNDKSDYGVFPGKLLEYMLIGAPILSLTCGTLPDGEVTNVVREGQFGIAYEQVHDSVDYPALKAYLKTAYQQWATQGAIDFHPVSAVLDRYNYENIITAIENLLNHESHYI